MSTFVVADALEHDHHEIDEQFACFTEGLGRGEWLSDAFEGGAEALRHHIYVEEEVLFPFLRVGGLVAPVFVMLREHAEIWQAIENVASALESDTGRARSGMATLTTALEQHNTKEEQVLYPAADKVLKARDVEAVRSEFEQGERPAGWLPTNLRR